MHRETKNGALILYIKGYCILWVMASVTSTDVLLLVRNRYMRSAVEFEQRGSELLLLYSPQYDDSWVQDKFKRGEILLIKGTFHLRQVHLITNELPDATDDSDSFIEPEPLRFKIAVLQGGYFSFDSEILHIGYPLLIHHQEL
ncbi:MAG: hypothetical protein DU480_14535 [Nitrosomonas sp.]